MRVYSGCDISPQAIIGKNCILPHPLGIVIGHKVRIGNDVTIFQQVTLGSHGKTNERMSYPIIEDGVRIYPKATVIGGVTVGKDAVIGTHSLVRCNVPAGRTAVGVPARLLPTKEKCL